MVGIIITKRKEKKGGNEYDGKHSRIGGFLYFFFFPPSSPLSLSGISLSLAALFYGLAGLCSRGGLFLVCDVIDLPTDFVISE